MPNKIPIRDIVKTYGLTPELTDKVTRIAAANIEKYGIVDFGDQYRYVTELVERFTQSYRERRFRRMDSPAGDYKRSLHEIIGAEDPHLSGLFEDGEQEPERQSLSGQEVLECLSGRLDAYDIRVLSALMKDDMRFDVSPDNLSNGAESIGQRIRQVAQRYETDGIVIVPKRPVISISFEPFSVRFGQSRYDKLTEDEKHEIIRMLWRNMGSVARTARETGYTHQMVRRCKDLMNSMNHYYRQKKLKYPSIGGPPDRVLMRLVESGQIEQLTRDELHLILAYEDVDGDPYEAERHSEYNASTFIRHWTGVGLEIRLRRTQ